MFFISRRKQFGPVTFLWDVEAPDVARAARPGHFVMARIDEHGERIPLTVADFDVSRGTVTVVVQAVGKTTHEMMLLKEGDAILDFIGPLGLPSHIRKLDGTVVLVGGGLGVAPIYPQLREYKNMGNRTVSIVGFRTRDLVFWEEQFRAVSDELIVTTDDGSYGRKGFVTHALADVLGISACPARFGWLGRRAQKTRVRFTTLATKSAVTTMSCFTWHPVRSFCSTTRAVLAS